MIKKFTIFTLLITFFINAQETYILNYDDVDLNPDENIFFSITIIRFVGILFVRQKFIRIYSFFIVIVVGTLQHPICEMPFPFKQYTIDVSKYYSI